MTHSEIDILLNLENEVVDIYRHLKRYANSDLEITARFYCSTSIRDGEVETECVEFFDVDTDEEIKIPDEHLNKFIDFVMYEYEPVAHKHAIQDAYEQWQESYDRHWDSKIDEAMGK